MGLSEDQKAMLRLLAQREQGYEDIAALMGLSVEQVRERVTDALSQLEDEGKDPPEELRAAGPVAQEGSSSSQAAGEEPSSTPPAAGAPAEETPAPPAPAREAPVSPPPQPAPQRARSSAPPKLSLPSGQGARAAIAAGVAVLVLVIVVLVVGGGGGSSDSSTTTSGSGGGETTSGSQNAAGEKEVTKAVLESVGGSGGSGVAIFGRVKKSLALQVEAEGLEPTAKGHSYTVWLAASPQKMLPLASTEVGNDGRIGAQFEVPTEVLAYLANEAFGEIVVTATTDSTLKASLNKATSEKEAPEYTGTPVLQGTVTGPIVGAAKRKQQ